MAGAVPRTLTPRALNRALLARQFLLERARLPPPRVLERVAGLQAQYAPAMYIGLWSRMEGFRRQHLTAALERRTVVQGTLMRSTIHLVSARDYWPLAAAIRSERRRWWLGASRGQCSSDELASAAARLRPQLAAGPMRRSAVAEVVSARLMGGIGLWIDLVRVPPSGTWERRRADLYAAAENWLQPVDVPPDTAKEHLVRRYLGGFGPAAPDEIADWAGLPRADVLAALERLRLRRFATEDGAELVDVPRAPLPPPETPAPVRFLPVWDATLLVHARRTGILPEEYRPTIFNVKTPHSMNTFLVDGTVAGTWRYEDGQVHVEPFDRLDGATTREVRAEADRLAVLYA